MLDYTFLEIEFLKRHKSIFENDLITFEEILRQLVCCFKDEFHTDIDSLIKSYETYKKKNTNDKYYHKRKFRLISIINEKKLNKKLLDEQTKQKTKYVIENMIVISYR